MKKNLLIGAISGNYTSKDLKNWIETSNWSDCTRILLYYNPSENNDLINYLDQNKICVLLPESDFWGNPKTKFDYNTGNCNFNVSYELIHNIRFYHIWQYLYHNHNVYNKVLITDVKDVYFNANPFDSIEIDKILATGEIVKYKEEEWNQTHLHYNLGMIGLNLLSDKQIYNVGVFGGGCELVKEICADIYLMSVGKHKVADQTSYNYLIQTKYKNKTSFTNNVVIHLHVINAGLVSFDLNTIPNYKIVHQYDRIPGFKR